MGNEISNPKEEFEGSEVFEKLFDMVNQHVEESSEDEYEEDELVLDPTNGFEDQEVVKSDSEVELKMVDRRESGYRTILSCKFLGESITEAYLDIGQQVGPMLGRGYRVSYSDGEYTESKWVS